MPESHAFVPSPRSTLCCAWAKSGRATCSARFPLKVSLVPLKRPSACGTPRDHPITFEEGDGPPRAGPFVASTPRRSMPSCWLPPPCRARSYMRIHAYSLRVHLAAESPRSQTTSQATRAMSASVQIMRSPGQPVGIQEFPGDVEQVVVLRNGASVRFRAISPHDAPRLMALCQRSSARTVYQRFFSPRRLRPEEAHALANVDYRERMALVAEVGTGESDLIGVARYGPGEEAATADIGLVVEDGWQGLGLGSILLKEILHAGAQRGIRHFRADVLTENRPALRLLARYTHIAQSTTSGSVTSITFHRREDSDAGALKPWGES